MECKFEEYMLNRFYWRRLFCFIGQIIQAIQPFFFTLIVFLNLHVIKELLWGTLKSTAPQPVAKETWVKKLPAIQ